MKLLRYGFPKKKDRSTFKSRLISKANIKLDIKWKTNKSIMAMAAMVECRSMFG